MDTAEDHWRAQPDTYDINFTVAPSRMPALSPIDQTLVQQAIQTRQPVFDVKACYAGKLLYLDRPLAEAREMLKALQDAGAHAGLIPRRYRQSIPEEAARRAAEDFLGFIRTVRGEEFGELGPGIRSQLWWRFSAPHLEAYAAGYAPGAAIIDIDSFDGHVCAEGELAAWGRFNDGQPPYPPGFKVDDVLLMADRLNTANATMGVRLQDCVGILSRGGAPGAEYFASLALNELKVLLGEQRAAIVLVRHPSGQWHTVVVDAVREDAILLRDSWPPHMGCSYAMPTADFASVWTGAAVGYPPRAATEPSAADEASPSSARFLARVRGNWRRKR